MLIVADCSNLIYLFCPLEFPVRPKTIFENIVLFFPSVSSCIVLFSTARGYAILPKNPDRICGWLCNIQLEVQNLCQPSTDGDCYLSIKYLLGHRRLFSIFEQIRLGVYCNFPPSSVSLWFRQGHLMVAIPWLLIHKHWSSLVRDTW